MASLQESQILNALKQKGYVEMTADDDVEEGFGRLFCKRQPPKEVGTFCRLSLWFPNPDLSLPHIIFNPCMEEIETTSTDEKDAWENNVQELYVGDHPDCPEGSEVQSTTNNLLTAEKLLSVISSFKH